MDLSTCLMESDGYTYKFKAGAFEFVVKRTDNNVWETRPEWSEVQWHLNTNSEALFDAIEAAMHEADEFMKTIADKEEQQFLEEISK